MSPVWVPPAFDEDVRDGFSDRELEMLAAAYAELEPEWLLGVPVEDLSGMWERQRALANRLLDEWDLGITSAELAAATRRLQH